MFKKKLYKYISVLYLDSFVGSKTYYYKTDIEGIKVGDYVLVDRAGYETQGKVVKVELFTKKNVPFPLDKTKDILGFIDGELYEKNLLKVNDLVITTQGRVCGIEEIYPEYGLVRVILLNDKNKGEIVIRPSDVSVKINNNHTCPKCGNEMVPYYYGYVDKEIEEFEDNNKIYIASHSFIEKSNDCIRYMYHCNNCNHDM